MRIALLLLALSGCGSPCETTCGLSSSEGSCRDLQTQEDRALSSFESFVDHWNAAWTCERLAGFSVNVSRESDGVTFLRDGALVEGYTDCGAKEIVVANADWPRNALTHEVAHAIEGCIGPPVLPVWHYGWEGRGIGPAIRNALSDNL